MFLVLSFSASRVKEGSGKSLGMRYGVGRALNMGTRGFRDGREMGHRRKSPREAYLGIHNYYSQLSYSRALLRITVTATVQYSPESISRPQLAHYSYVLSVWLSVSFWPRPPPSLLLASVLGAITCISDSDELFTLQLQLRDELIKLQLQLQLQSCNSLELITWL